ncbi:MAG: hypothetical protein ABSE71_02510 [Candidatus Micrarchaeaceae archaeon]|jgi:hypothetical protein|nr:hypothetical protein [Candidatus Micrarchaeota archaeon]HII09783.1 hypothetical protein [Candidatus Micrarchaeota archaeon]
MHKGIVAYIIVIIILVVLAVLYTGYNFIKPLHPLATTSTIKPSSNTTTIVATTSINSSTINYSNSVSPCASFILIGQQPNSTYTTKCSTSGATLGLWVAAGTSGTESVKIVGANGRTYVNQSSNYNCTTFFQNFSAPAQLYTITFKTGVGGGSCGNPVIIINTTSTPPVTAYTYVLNGNFGNGQFTGWNVSGAGFGAGPFNITYQDAKMCYRGSPWTNYNGTYFATTYNCAISVAPGNLTSAPLIVTSGKPFLNFRVISPQDNGLYIELFRGSTPVTIAHFNTYNQSLTINGSSTFQNVSIPLTPYIGQQLRIKVVGDAINRNNYIAIGDFATAKRPIQQKGVAVNITTLSN